MSDEMRAAEKNGRKKEKKTHKGQGKSQHTEKGTHPGNP